MTDPRTPADAERAFFEAERRRQQRHAAEFGDVDDDDAYDAADEHEKPEP